MHDQIHLTRKERGAYFYKLLLMYAAAVGILSLIFFWNARGKTASDPEWKSRFAERENFSKAQIDAIRIVDSMAVTMELLKGDARQTFIQADLQEMVRHLSALYGDGSGYDGRALAFIQASRFMQLRLEDVLTLNNEKSNTALFEQQLNSCKAGYSAAISGPPR